jgi:hypothetical protein
LVGNAPLIAPIIRLWSMNKNGGYDTIGRGYALNRRADSRVARQILDALGDAATVVNVGAGTGSYEPRNHRGDGC